MITPPRPTSAPGGMKIILLNKKKKKFVILSFSGFHFLFFSNLFLLINMREEYCDSIFIFIITWWRRGRNSEIKIRRAIAACRRSCHYSGKILLFFYFFPGGSPSALRIDYRFLLPLMSTALMIHNHELR